MWFSELDKLETVFFIHYEYVVTLGREYLIRFFPNNCFYI